MILSVLVGGSSYSAVLLQTDPIKVVDHASGWFPYNADKMLRPVSNDLIARILEEKFGRNDAKIVVTVFTATPYVKNQYTMDQIVKSMPFHIINIDHTKSYPYSWLEVEKIDKYETCLEYHCPIDFEMKKKHDFWFFEEYVKENVGNFINMDQVVVVSADVPEKDRLGYLEKLVDIFASSIKIAGVWKFNLDDQNLLLPVSAGLLDEQTDIKAFFSQNPVETEAKLIKAPGAVEIKVGDDIRSFEPDSVNKIELSDKESKKFEWKSKKSKFNGELFGSKTGILFDNREING